MADNLTLEAFLSLLDGAESVVKGDNLSERRVSSTHRIAQRTLNPAMTAPAASPVSPMPFRFSIPSPYLCSWPLFQKVSPFFLMEEGTTSINGLWPWASSVQTLLSLPS